MPHAGFLTLLAAGPIRPRTEPTQFRQTIRARLSGDARLGQNSASAALAEGRDRKNVREISRSISSPDRSGHLARLDNLHKMALSCRAKRNISVFPDGRGFRTVQRFFSRDSGIRMTYDSARHLIHHDRPAAVRYDRCAG